MPLANLLFSLLILFLTTILPSYTNPFTQEQADCVANYLLISKNFKTKIFAEEFGEDWKIQRGIPRELLENLKIKRKEMAEVMSKGYADVCFGKLGKQNEENFSVKDIKTTTGKNHLILSRDFQDKLSQQSLCLANFLIETFGSEFIKAIAVPSYKHNEEVAILDHFKKLWENGYYVFRLKLKLTLNNRFILENYKKGTQEFEEIEKCYKHFSLKG
ncbi:unnamed protein product [Meloidogyne enterolobii]|uniref:Uncharacterized protein n=1 Tax=Meloidogyne enterolobii TaxID=390850 RepID=A0ACB1AQI8_MELEN